MSARESPGRRAGNPRPGSRGRAAARSGSGNRGAGRAPAAPPIELELDIERFGHGGYGIAHHEGRVVLVRSAAPGERVLACIDDPRPEARFWRGEAVAVRVAHAARVPLPWPEAGPGGIGGADLSFLDLATQRHLLGEVCRDLLTRAGVASPLVADLHVEAVPGDTNGLATRTRVQFAVDGQRAGMRRWRSHDVLAVGSNPLAVPEINALGLGELSYTGIGGLSVSAPAAGGSPLVVVHPTAHVDEVVVPSAWRGGELSVLVEGPRGGTLMQGRGSVLERVGGDFYRVSGSGFWQVHRSGAELLRSLVLEAVGAEPGEQVWDLFSGAGLFSLALADAVGPRGRIVAIEGSEVATRDARHNLADRDWVELVSGDVAARLPTRVARPERPDVIVLDPPRSGAGEGLIARLTDLARRRIVYVSCDPATLARDLVVAESRGWQLTSIRALDLFPMTHHVELVAVLEPEPAAEK